MTDLAEALRWALAELRGETQYKNEAQRTACFARADDALAEALVAAEGPSVGMSEANAPIPAVQSGAVAWRWRYKGTNWVYGSDRPAWADVDDCDEVIEPLYAAPQTAIQATLGGAFITTVSFGDPDPARRSAEVRIVFSGDDPAAKAHAAHDAILGILAAPQSEPLPGGVGEADVRLLMKARSAIEAGLATLNGLGAKVGGRVSLMATTSAEITARLAALSGKEQG